MAAMSRIVTATVLFFEFQSISSLTGYQIQQEEQAGPGQVYAVPNGGPTFTFYGNQNPPFNSPFNPNVPRPGAGPFQRPFPPNGHNLIIHNPRFQNYGNGPSNNNIPIDAPQPDIPSVKGPPTFIFDAQPPNPQNGGPLLPQRPYQPPAAPLNPRPIPRPNPSDPQMPKSPQSPQSPPPPPKQPVAPKQGTQSEGTPTEEQGGTQQESGPIINAQNAEMSGGEVFIQHGQVERDTFLYSTQAQILIGTLAAFFSLCALIRCYSKCCWDKVNKRTMDHDAYQQGAAVTRHDTNHIEADVDWSDHTENEDDPLDDYDDDNAMTDVQQMRSRKARELVPDESIDSGIYSNHDDRSSLEIDRADVQILMDEEDNNNNNNDKEQYPLTDDETRAIMKEFKDTDDEYVD